MIVLPRVHERVVTRERGREFGTGGVARLSGSTGTAGLVSILSRQSVPAGGLATQAMATHSSGLRVLRPKRRSSPPLSRVGNAIPQFVQKVLHEDLGLRFAEFLQDVLDEGLG
jgi:hypothetical protein